MELLLYVMILSVCYVQCEVFRECISTKPIFHMEGNATITAIFDGHRGPNCSVISDKGLLQMTSFIWLIDAINSVELLPGIHIGLNLFDSCSSNITRQKILNGLLENETCLHPYPLGIIMASGQNFTPRNIQDTTPIMKTTEWNNSAFLIRLAISTLESLHKNTVDIVLAPTPKLLDRFSHSATISGVCLLQEIIMRNNEHRNWTTELHTSLKNRNTQHPILIITFCNREQMFESLETVSSTNVTVQWIIIPMDAILETVSEIVPIDSSALVIAMQESFVKRIGESTLDYILHKDINETEGMEKIASFKNNLFLGVASPVLSVIHKLQVAVSQYCQPENNVCKELPSFNTFSSLHTVDSSLSDLKKILNSPKENINYGIYSFNFGNVEEVGVFQLLNNTLHLNLTLVNNKTSNSEFLGCSTDVNITNISKCNKCVNFVKSYYIKISFWYNNLIWRNEGWVAAVISISTIGIACCFSIAIFILVRVCKRDLLEGNPGFSLLLLIAIMCIYISVLPFSFKVADNLNGHGTLLCTLRILGTTLSYALLFSIMVSRSLLLASCDKDGGFMSHINGYIQTVLCFFVVGVQVALSLQFFFINTSFIKYDDCSTMYDGYYFLILLAYDMFLLFLLVCISPFIIRSKRNYSEGMYFTFAAIICLVLWVSWCSAYMLVPQKWKDAAVAAGLTSIATTVLIVIFIPRTYLIMSGVVRDRLASALPSLAYATAASIQDLHFRINDSSQALYDTVHQTSSGQTNPNYYSDQPQFPDPPSLVQKQANHCSDERNFTPENTYERYDSPPSPDKVTRF